MAREFDNALSQYLSRGPIVSSTPFSIACWFNLDDDEQSDYLMGISDASDASDRITFYVAFTTDLLYVSWTPQGADNSAVTTSTVTYDTWQHACAVVAAPNDLRVYLDGGNKGTGVAAGGAMQWANMDTVSIGALVWNNTSGGYVDGAIAHEAIWNVALTDTEAMLLAKKRLSPLLVRPQNLIALWGLDHGDNGDWRGRYGMTPTNTPRDIASPPIVYPERNDPVWGLMLPRYRPRHYRALRPLPIIGSTAWGHVTGVVEDNTRPFDGKWSGTGDVERVGDNEQIALASGEYMESEVVNTGTNLYEIDQNVYQAGDDVTIKFRHGATEAACLAAAYGNYTVPFDSLGFVQIRLESTL
jgi:hypothetical protein